MNIIRGKKKKKKGDRKQRPRKEEKKHQNQREPKNQKETGKRGSVTASKCCNCNKGGKL